jgi:hypothetical protein
LKVAPPQVSTGFVFPAADSTEEGKEKQLPPVPLALMKKQDGAADEEEVRLSPTVYSPQRTLSKGKGKDKDNTSGPTTMVSPGSRHAPENYARVDEAEWI